ncbi:hypothetical protein D3C73_1190400 [compost metagenome]
MRSLVFIDHYRRPFHPEVTLNRQANFIKLDTVTAQFNLVICAAGKVIATEAIPINHIASAIHARMFRSRGKWIRKKPFSR